MDVKVTNRTLGKRATVLEQRVSRAVYATADDVESYVKVVSPVDTGALQKSYVATPESATSAVVGSDLDYSVYVEYGTSKMPAQPHLTPAVDAARPDFIARLTKAIADA